VTNSLRLCRISVKDFRDHNWFNSYCCVHVLLPLLIKGTQNAKFIYFNNATIIHIVNSNSSPWYGWNIAESDVKHQNSNSFPILINLAIIKNDGRINHVHHVKMWNMIAKIYVEKPGNIQPITVDKLLIKYLRTFHYSSYILKNDNCLRICSI
jgi:hypothetical protein